MVEMVWLDEEDNVLGTVTGVDETDASDAMLRLIEREERGLRHGDHFETGDYSLEISEE